MRTDIIINSERYDTTVLPSLKYHAPYLKWDVDSVLEDTTTNVVAGQRAPQVLSAEAIAEIQRMPTFVQDTRFYLFADKVAVVVIIFGTTIVIVASIITTIIGNV